MRRPGGGGGSGGRGGRRGEFSKRYTPRRKVCTFCVDKISYIDYKDIPRLRRHLSERGKIEPRRKTGTCAKHQRALAVALKRARHVALLPFTAEHIRLSGMVLRSPDDRRRDDRGPRRDMPPRVAIDGAGTPAAAPADGSATPGAAAPGAATPGAAPIEGAGAPDATAPGAAPADGAAEPMGAPLATNGAAPAASVAAPAHSPVTETPVGVTPQAEPAEPAAATAPAAATTEPSASE